MTEQQRKEELLELSEKENGMKCCGAQLLRRQIFSLQLHLASFPSVFYFSFSYFCLSLLFIAGFVFLYFFYSLNLHHLEKELQQKNTKIRSFNFFVRFDDKSGYFCHSFNIIIFYF
jgi:hypothetical protein